VWDVSTRREVARLNSTKEGSLQGGFLAPDGTTFVVLEHEKQATIVRVRKRANFELLREFAVGDLRMPCLSPTASSWPATSSATSPFARSKYGTSRRGKGSIASRRTRTTSGAYNSPRWKDPRHHRRGQADPPLGRGNRKLRREITGLPTIGQASGLLRRRRDVSNTWHEGGRRASRHDFVLGDVPLRRADHAMGRRSGKELRQLAMPLRPGFASEGNFFPC